MLFKPPAERRLAAVQALLITWNDEADRIRAAARAALAGSAPSAAILHAAEEAQHDLAALEDEVAWLLDGLPPGDADFCRLLHAQIAAASLRESIDNSLDVLDRFAPEPSPRAVTIHHPSSTTSAST